MLGALMSHMKFCKMIKKSYVCLLLVLMLYVPINIQEYVTWIHVFMSMYGQYVYNVNGDADNFPINIF